MAVIVSPVSGTTVDTIQGIDAIMGMLHADLVTLIAGADIELRYPELERSYGEYGAIIKEGRIPAAVGRTVNPQTTSLCDPAYFELDSKVYDNWVEAVYPHEIRRVDVTKIVTSQQEYDDLLMRIARSVVEGYRAEVNRAIDQTFSRQTNPTLTNTLFAYDTEVGMPDGILYDTSRYEALDNSEGTPTFRDVWGEILAVAMDMMCENSTYTEGDNIYGARAEDLVIYVPHRFLANSDIKYIQTLFNERGMMKLPEVRTHNGASIDGYTVDGTPYPNPQAIFIMDKRVINHVVRFFEAGSHDVDCRKSRVFDLHVEHMIKYAPFYKAWAIITPMPVE